MAVAAQGLGTTRPLRAGRGNVLAAVSTVGALQLDAINVLERTQFLTLFARIGPYDVSHVHRLTGPFGRLYETPGTLAELVPMEHYPLFRPEVARGASTDTPRRREALADYMRANRAYIVGVRRQVEAEGPLTAAQLHDPRRRGRGVVGPAQRRPPGAGVPVPPGGGVRLADAVFSVCTTSPSA